MQCIRSRSNIYDIQLHFTDKTSIGTYEESIKKKMLSQTSSMVSFFFYYDGIALLICIDFMHFTHCDYLI